MVRGIAFVALVALAAGCDPGVKLDKCWEDPARPGCAGTTAEQSKRPSPALPSPLPGVAAIVVRDVDGDTIVVAGLDPERSTTIRLLGVNTPETHKPHWPVEHCGPEAEQYTAAVAARGTAVRVEVAGDRVDRYGRTLAYVYVGAFDLNLELLKRGYADVTTFRHPRRDEFRAARDAARKAGVGCLWGGR